MTPVVFAAGISPALEKELARNGVRFKTVNGQLLVNDETLFFSIANAFDQVAGARPVKIEEIKAEAQRRIYGVIPEWKQANLNARAIELILKGNLTQAEQQELTAGQALWTRAKAIRAASNAIETRLAQVSIRDDVVIFDAAGAPEWPE